MKITGTILLILGILSALGSLLAISNGISTSPVGGLFFIVLGAFLISRANKKKEEESNRIKWEQENTDDN